MKEDEIVKRRKPKTYVLICGVGINDYEGRVKINKKHIRSYKAWHGILTRCYSEESLRQKPTYKGCTVCEKWKLFSNFKRWFDKNYRYDLEEMGLKPCLDKDLLSNGLNKIYSPETCIFLPQKVNKFLTNKKLDNTSGYTGVTWHTRDNKWAVSINDFYAGKNKHLGYFTDIELANKTYVEARRIEADKCKKWMLELGYSKEIVDCIK